MAVGAKTGGGSRKGIPNKATADVKVAAREYGPAAIKRLAELGGLINGKPAAQSEAAQVQACNTILDRAYGKAAQPLTGGDETDQPIKHALTVKFV